MPIMLLFMAAFFVSFTDMFTPEAGWFTICSFVPFLAAMVMFVRICMTDVPGWQIMISIVIQLAAIWATGWLSAKIYRLGVLMYGKPPKLKELTRMLRNAR
jgi:ABC-2 type transport system permease protein